MYAYLLTHSLAVVSSVRSGRLEVAIFLRSWESEWEESDTHKKKELKPQQFGLKNEKKNLYTVEGKRSIE